MRVWVEDWQHECCGDPFAVGDPVKWMVGDPDPDFGLPDVPVENHHGPDDDKDDLRPVGGVVRRIQVAYVAHRDAPELGLRVAVWDTLTLVDVTGTRQYFDDVERDGRTLEWVGFLVDLDVH